LSNAVASGVTSLYIGLLSGTSIDAIDAAVIATDGRGVSLLETSSKAIPADLRHRLLILTEAPLVSLEEVGELDRVLGVLLAEAALELLEKAGIPTRDVRAIGSHGQTVRHRPPRGGKYGFSTQIGDPNTIAELTGICTVADFRRRDVAAGGQGAPLVPAFHDRIFREPGIDRVIANIGGISNISLLPGESIAPVSGFDTGPGNTLMDAWTLRHRDQPFDRGGQWAKTGRLNEELLGDLMAHPFLTMSPPKSTGREEFNLVWLGEALSALPGIEPQDVQATLLEFTARTLSNGIRLSMPTCKEVFLCGGGAMNHFLVDRLKALLAEQRVATTESLGVHPDWVEACAFAWLAHQTLEGESGNLPAATGASRQACLGGIYPGERLLRTL
jgi:anhydro-N-acetylmuramic acid kinase